MKKLLLYRSEISTDGVNPDIDHWSGIYNVITKNVSLVDRCNKIEFPYLIKNSFPIPTNLYNFNKTYKQLCLERAEWLINHSRKIGKPILLLYSGGIDSTTVVVSFIEAANGNTNDIVIALNPDSMQENTKFYFKHIRGKFRLLASEHILDVLNGQYVMVGGEFNDQLFGSDLMLPFQLKFSLEAMLQKYSESNIVSFFTASGMGIESAKIWFDILDHQIKSTNLCEIYSVKDFLWWYNFSFKWQSVYYRIISRTGNRNLITDQFLDDYYHQFFVTEEFQKWSMLNPDKKHGDTWESYKLAAKQFILDFTHDQDYFNNKMKMGSLFGVFKRRPVPDALGYDTETKEYLFLDTLRKNEYYNAGNDFNKI